MPATTPSMRAVPMPTNQPACKLCRCGPLLETEQKRGLCADCQQRPEAKKFLTPAPPSNGNGAKPHGMPRPFTAADVALIKSLAHAIPALDLLRLLNHRLVADLGGDAPRYTMAMLDTAVAAIRKPESAEDWGGLRRLLAEARTTGLLATITAQTIKDFAVVYQCAPAQLMRLKDILRSAQDHD